ncbi:MAG: histidinol-phosphate transaminase [Ignavibacteria bacterium]|nr:histidinol-phosphate transaminase [Ignavibacteria bacterium]
MLTPNYIKNLKPYVPGKPIEELQREFNIERIYKIASNENSLGPSPKAVEAMINYMSESHRYPEVGAFDLRNKISKKFNLKIENIAVGNGSEGIMANALRSFLCDGEEIISSESTFIGFQVLARGRANKYVEVPMLPGKYKFDLDGILNAVNSNTKIIYLCNPNNPTGTIFTKKEFEEFIKKIPENILVMIDEAYFEYATMYPEYPDSLFYRFDNVITLRTFSKIYGIAGIRLGYGFARNEIVETIMKVKLPFEPSIIAQAAGIAALDDDDFVKMSLEMNREGYNFLTSELSNLNIKWIPSYANFIMIDMGKEEYVVKLNDYMLKNGIIIRPLKAFGLPHCIRVTIGTPEENNAFVDYLRKYLKK